MTASRILLACKMLHLEICLCQPDCDAAYVQAAMPADDVTYVYLPRSWLPERWFNVDGSCKFKNLVAPRKKALFGHPRAGDLWADKLSKVLESEGFIPVPDWPSMYIKFVPGELPQVIDVYVDDLTMLGPLGSLGRTLQVIRKVIKIEAW